ncbi:F-box/RNI-like superfamily protein [Prunus dulcis]|uniref:F-box/RNI-like superfamily protein n=1 Tax=Prunus dulcis TaxID=3755 RepID=A0A5H2XP51_PRUDU|nr:F-box/RNI-like superfamily protein [Prunus dulcis]
MDHLWFVFGQLLSQSHTLVYHHFQSSGRQAWLNIESEVTQSLIFRSFPHVFQQANRENRVNQWRISSSGNASHDRKWVRIQSLVKHAMKIGSDFSRIDAWIRTAIMRNVVELDLELYEYSNPPHPFVLPRSLFMCKTLVLLKLRLQSNFIALAPASDCFPSLKFLHVDVVLPDADSMEKLFSCCPALEDLVIEGEPGYDSVLNFEVSAPKLKRLRISWYIVPFHQNYDRKVFINADVPSLEEFNLQENILANYSLKNAHSLSRAKIDLFGTVRDSADHIQWLFAEIRNVKFLSLSAPVFGGPCSVYQYHLPTFNNLNHLELLLQNCCSLRSVTNFLQISPKLEHLVFENSIHCYVCHFVDKSVHEWSPPDFVPACLLSHLKTIRIRGFQGLPDEMEVVEYLLKYGVVLNTITICTLEYFCEEKEMKCPLLGRREEIKLFFYGYQNKRNLPGLKD